MATRTVDWADLQWRHSNWLRAGDPVVPWDQFKSVATDLITAEAEFQAALDEANTHLDRLVPPKQRYCAWYCYAPKPIVAIYDLFGDAPNSLHPSDLRFNLSYGKSKRAPLEHMRKLAEKYRAYTRKVKRVLAKNLAAAESAVAD